MVSNNKVFCKTMSGAVKDLTEDHDTVYVHPTSKVCDYSYIHPSTRQCVIPVVSATESGLMTPDMLARLNAVDTTEWIAIGQNYQLNFSDTDQRVSTYSEYTWDVLPLSNIGTFSFSIYKRLRLDYALTCTLGCWGSGIQRLKLNGVVFETDPNGSEWRNTYYSGSLFAKQSGSSYVVSKQSNFSSQLGTATQISTLQASLYQEIDNDRFDISITGSLSLFGSKT